MFVDNIWKYLSSHNMLRSFLHLILNQVISVVFRVFWIFSIQEKKIVFINYSGKGYGDNPKYIAEEILERKVDFDMVWLTSPEYMFTKFPSGVRVIPYNSVRAMYELATASVWISSNRMEGYVRKRRGQKYIQTWHGGFALKKVEADVPDSPKWYVRASQNDSRMADVFVSNSEIHSNVYRTSFWYTGSILEVGYPRNDSLVVHERLLLSKDVVYSRLQHDVILTANKKILLYAPTFRNDLLYSDLNPDFVQWLNQISTKFGGEWIVLLRLHPNITKTVDISSLCDNVRVFDVSYYTDMQELLAVADILVTDYSSCMFDFGLTKRPCFLYAPDVETYISDDRGFYIQLTELPFPLYKSNKEFISGIESFNSVGYQKNLEWFYEKYGSFEEGDAAEKVVDWIVYQMG